MNVLVGGGQGHRSGLNVGPDTTKAFDDSRSVSGAYDPLPAEHPDVGVLLLSQYVEEEYANELLAGDTRGLGYLLKDRVADIDRFTDAVRRVAEGGSALDPEVVSLLLGRRRREDPLGGLTPREREVLELMAEGRSNVAIAEALVVTERAVEKHVTSIFVKSTCTSPNASVSIADVPWLTRSAALTRASNSRGLNGFVT